jgi:hypothetical protein
MKTLKFRLEYDPKSRKGIARNVTLDGIPFNQTDRNPNNHLAKLITEKIKHYLEGAQSKDSGSEITDYIYTT